MYTPTAFATPSPRAQALSQELIALVAQRRSHDPGLGISDALVALELAKASLLSEGTGRAPQWLAIAAAVLAAVIAGFVVFFELP